MTVKLHNGGSYTVLTPKPPAIGRKITHYSVLELTGEIRAVKLSGYLVLTPKPPAKLFTLNKYAIVAPVPPVKGRKASIYTVLRAANIVAFNKKLTLYGVLVARPTLNLKLNGYSVMVLQGAIGTRAEKLTSYVAIQYVPPTGTYVTVNVS
jgi:hypothetical protein